MVLPANLAVGHLLVCLATDKNGTGTVSFSAGTWTSQQVVNTGRRGSISWIAIDSTSLAALGTPGSSTVTVTQGSGTSRRVVELILVSGRNLVSPLDAVGAEYQQGAASATWSVTGLTARAQSDILALGYNNAASNVQYSMAPTDGLTQEDNPYIFDGASATTLHVLYQNNVPAGATGTRTATISPTPTIVAGGFMIAFAAAPPPPIMQISQAIRQAAIW